MSVLLELNDVLDNLGENQLETTIEGAALHAADNREEQVDQPAQCTSRAQQGDHIPLQSSLEQHASRHGPRDNGTQHRGRDSISNNSCCAASSSGFRKDFRINGHVGESTSKDTLSFSSLEHQIDSSLRKGYLEMEIVEAVIHALSPGLELKSYLEGKTDLTLSPLRQILGAQ